MMTVAGALRAFLLLSAVLLLSGCAAERSFREARDLAAGGDVEASLAKFQDAVKLDPRNPEYRAVYLETRDRSASALLEQADRLARRDRGLPDEIDHPRLPDQVFQRDRRRLGQPWQVAIPQ